MTIDQAELGLHTMKPGSLKIEQIPSQAKIKSFTVWLIYTVATLIYKSNLLSFLQMMENILASILG